MNEKTKQEAQERVLMRAREIVGIVRRVGHVDPYGETVRALIIAVEELERHDEWFGRCARDEG